MDWLVLLLTVSYFSWLVLENFLAVRWRAKLSHVIYINGTRGKSSVTRLIDAGLRAGGLRCFCKTTGTLPMVIRTNGEESQLNRRGCANIREQLSILRRAAKEQAQVLALECMAVDPVLQAVSQHRMLRADVGVLTNVRLDHTDVMGGTLPEIAQALSNTIPKNGVLFTAEQGQFDLLAQNARALGTKAFQTCPPEDAEENAPPDFPENVELALAVCVYLGVDRDTALRGMASFHRDPYALAVYRLPAGGLFINAMSANDPQSTVMIYRRMEERFSLGGRHAVLLLNSRPDRPERTAQLAKMARSLRPDEIWLLGMGSGLLRRKLLRVGMAVPIRRFSSSQDVPLAQAGPNTAIFAAGNIAGPGRLLAERVKEEGTQDVL